MGGETNNRCEERSERARHKEPEKVEEVLMRLEAVLENPEMVVGVNMGENCSQTEVG